MILLLVHLFCIALNVFRRPEDGLIAYLFLGPECKINFLIDMGFSISNVRDGRARAWEWASMNEWNMTFVMPLYLLTFDSGYDGGAPME